MSSTCLLPTWRQKERGAPLPTTRIEDETKTKTINNQSYYALFTQHPDAKESGKKAHGRSLMTNVGKHKVNELRVIICITQLI